MMIQNALAKSGTVLYKMTNVAIKAPTTIWPIPVNNAFLATKYAPARIKPMPKPNKAMTKISTKAAKDNHGVNKQTPIVNTTEPNTKSVTAVVSFLDKPVHAKMSKHAPATVKMIPKYKSIAEPIPQIAMIMPNATKIAPSRILTSLLLFFIIKFSFQKEIIIKNENI